MIFRRNSLIRENPEPSGDALILFLIAVAASIIGLVLFGGRDTRAPTGPRFEALDSSFGPAKKRVHFNPVVTVQEIEPMRRQDFPDYFGEI